MALLRAGFFPRDEGHSSAAFERACPVTCVGDVVLERGDQEGAEFPFAWVYSSQALLIEQLDEK